MPAMLVAWAAGAGASRAGRAPKTAARGSGTIPPAWTVRRDGTATGAIVRRPGAAPAYGSLDSSSEPAAGGLSRSSVSMRSPRSTESS